MNPELSVIIPVYNVEKYLCQCIDSIISQDYQNVEIVLVDDGSPDKCPEICDAYVNRYSNIKVVHQKNGGLSEARNTGIKNATGRYITFLDSDDYWNSECSVQKIMNQVFENNSIDVFVVNCIGEYLDGTRMKREYINQLIYSGKNDIDYIYNRMIQIGDIFEAAYIKIIKREFITKNELFFKSGIISEDNEWSFRVMRCAQSIKFFPEDLVIYRAQREGSITSTAGFRSVRDLMSIVDSSKQYYMKYPEEIQRIGKYELAHCAYLWFIALGNYGGIKKGKDKKRALKLLRANRDIVKYSSSKKTKCSAILCRLLGIPFTSWILQMYIRLMRKNVISNKKEVEKV